ncbi:MAG: hypothetical protein PXY39_12660 [archaeon]|nr:hypothetical protein [archaeon]
MSHLRNRSSTKNGGPTTRAGPHSPGDFVRGGNKITQGPQHTTPNSIVNLALGILILGALGGIEFEFVGVGALVLYFSSSSSSGFLPFTLVFLFEGVVTALAIPSAYWLYKRRKRAVLGIFASAAEASFPLAILVIGFSSINAVTVVVSGIWTSFDLIPAFVIYLMWKRKEFSFSSP